MVDAEFECWGAEKNLTGCGSACMTLALEGGVPRPAGG